MLRPQGYVSVEGFTHVERDTITCGHCNKIVVVKPGSASTVYFIPDDKNPFFPMKEEAGAMCKQCMRAICLECYDKGMCLPLMKWIEKKEARGRMFRDVGV